MHPRLTLENNQACVEQIQALQKCHDDNSYLQKLLGACNDPKHALSACFKAQKKVPPRALRATENPGRPLICHLTIYARTPSQLKVKASLDKARDNRERVERLWAEYDQKPQPSS